MHKYSQILYIKKFDPKSTGQNLVDIKSIYIH